MTMEIQELQGFYFTRDDGYMALSHYSDPEDETTGQLVSFVEAGDTLVGIVTKARELQREEQ